MALARKTEPLLFSRPVHCARKLQPVGRPRNSKPWRWIELIEMAGAIIRSCGARFVGNRIDIPWQQDRKRERERKRERKRTSLSFTRTSLSSGFIKTCNYNLIINLSSLDVPSRNDTLGYRWKLLVPLFSRSREPDRLFTARFLRLKDEIVARQEILFFYFLSFYSFLSNELVRT